MAAFFALLVALGFLLALACPYVCYLLWKRDREAKRLALKLGAITDVEAEAARVRAELLAETVRTRSALEADARRVHGEMEDYINRTQAAVQAEAHRAATELQRQKVLANEELDDQRVAIAELREERALLEDTLIGSRINLPTHAYDDSDAFTEALVDVRDRQKRLVKYGEAATCSTSWEVGGNAKEGDRMVKRTLDLMLRAFNGECDGAISRANAGNERTIAARIEKAAVAINRLGAKQHCTVQEAYVALKLEELAYVCARQLTLAREKEEQRAIREQMRDEAIRLREVEQAEREAQAEETRFERALLLARKQMENSQADQRDAFEAKVLALEGQLAEAHAKMQRAVSQAQLTKAGHVYIISNIGSFGEHVYKVGMTRRLDPQDRVDELGDASVPFRFDVHALIYSTDAPALEKALHDALEAHRVNRVNPRKEFFRAELDYIRQVAEQHHGSFRLTLAAEAAEYRVSLELAERAMSRVA